MSQERRRGSLFLKILIFLLLLAVFRAAAPSMLEAYGAWLVVEDSLRASDAVVALAGGDGERLQAAIALYKGGMARRLLIVGPDTPYLPVYTGADSLTQGEAKRRIAVKKGVPAESVLLALGATSTYEEARTTLEQAVQEDWRSVVVVTSPFHTRRTRATFHSIFRDTPIEVQVFHLPEGRTSQSIPRWWRRESDTMAIATETIKLAYYIYRYQIFPWS